VARTSQAVRRVKELHIENGLLEEVSRALQADGVETDPGFLSNLQQIFAEDNLFASFIDTRRVMGLPIQFMATSPAFPIPKLRQRPPLLKPERPGQALGGSG
jgi:hypothetical protein